MDPKSLLRIWIDAFERKDLPAVIECYADDAVNFQVAAGGPSIGREQIGKDTAEFFQGFPDAWARVDNLIGDGDWAAWEWFGGGSFLGEFYGIEPTGKPFELHGCGFFNFRGGKIILQRGYWDKFTWFTQVGLPLE